MQTLDAILFEKSKVLYSKELSDIMDIDTWSKDNLDSKIDTIVKMGENISNEAVKFIAELQEKTVNGEPILRAKVREQCLVMKLDILEQFRLGLDTLDDKEASEFPFDYPWVNAQIKATNKEIMELSTAIDEVLDPTPVVEEL